MHPEVLFGIGGVALFIALIFAAVRAGWLTPRERRRTDAATAAMQKSEEAQQRREI
jgi:hypothetical protein